MTVSNQALETGADKYFDTQLQAGVFTIQRCAQCNNSIFYPRMICPHCGSDDLQWYEPSGKGTVYSTTVVRNKPEKGATITSPDRPGGRPPHDEPGRTDCAR